MKRSSLLIIVISLTALATWVLYRPASILVYKIREPYFMCPIKTGQREVVIRNDDSGEGVFGARRRNGRTHAGIDIQANVGTPVYASKSGIAFCGNVPTGYGKYVMIYHPDGLQTMYGHLSEWAVRSTQKVHRGDLIGFTGKTGNASGKSIQPHLHFEIRRDGDPQDPRPIMRY